MHLTIHLAAVAAIAVAAPAAANLLTNGDFEAGNTGFTSGYVFTSPLGFNQPGYTITANPADSVNAMTPSVSYGDHTTGSGLMMMVTEGDELGELIWQQDVAVSAGASYMFSLWTRAYFIGGAFDLFINGEQVGFTQTAFNELAWEEHSYGWTAATGNADIQLRGASASPFALGGYTLDDIEFQRVDGPAPVPAPAALALFGLGLAMIAKRRRR